MCAKAVYHQGPVSVFLSQATGAVEDYEGDGAWLKIADIGKEKRKSIMDPGL